MSRMMWNILLGLIYTSSEISPGAGFANEKKSSTYTSKSTIRAIRKAVERQHHINYLDNEVIYRNWPEVHENPKYDCQKFLKKIFPKKKDLASSISKIRKVILQYKQIRDKNNKMLAAKRVTALECQLLKPIWRRKFIYFIRSPQSPECALFLNRIQKKSFNFYIVKNICEWEKYHNFWTYTKELKDDKPKHDITESKLHKRKMFQLPAEEIKLKHAEFEQRHYEYCSINAEECKLWPEIQINPEYDCHRFIRRMFSQNKDLSMIIGAFLPVILHYLEIREENNERFDPEALCAITCQLPDIVEGCKYVYFIRAPTYPNCVFLIFYKKTPPQHFYIAEEICDTPNHTTTLHAILFERGNSCSLATGK